LSDAQALAAARKVTVAAALADATGAAPRPKGSGFIVSCFEVSFKDVLKLTLQSTVTAWRLSLLNMRPLSIRFQHTTQIIPTNMLRR